MTSDVAVVGGGLIGLAVARNAARAGARVVVFEREEPGMRASWAAAGMLAPQAEADAPGEFLSLLLAARDVYPAIVEELREETGMDVGYRNDGMLVVALDEAGERELAERHAWQSAFGLTVERLSGAEARALEPALAPEIRMALRFPGDHQVDNRLLTRAMLVAAIGAGCEVRVGRNVRGIARSGDAVRVVLHDGTAHESGAVVIAGGSWSGLIQGLPRPIPVRPVHGQLFAIEMSPLPMRHTVASGGAYMVPRADGRLIVGATVEEVGFRDAVTPAGLRDLAAASIRLVPGVGDRRVIDQWSGFRPGTPDGLPILGPDPEMPRLFYATGHYRNGILLAPITGTIIGSLAVGEPVSLDLRPYRPERF